MRYPKISKAIVVSLGACLLFFAAALAEQKATESKEKGEGSKIMDAKKLPPAVQKTVQEQTKGATVLGLSKEVENGKTQYELETKVNGRTRDLLIDPAGKVVEVEEEVDIASLPAAVQAEMKKSLGEGRIVRLESITKDGVLTAYEASAQKGGKKSSVEMGPDGKILPKERNEKN
jgi:hypothetical protein